MPRPVRIVQEWPSVIVRCLSRTVARTRPQESRTSALTWTSPPTAASRRLGPGLCRLATWGAARRCGRRFRGERLLFLPPVTKSQQQFSSERREDDGAPDADDDAADMTEAAEGEHADRPAQTAECHEQPEWFT